MSTCCKNTIECISQIPEYFDDADDFIGKVEDILFSLLENEDLDGNRIRSQAFVLQFILCVARAMRKDKIIS